MAMGTFYNEIKGMKVKELPTHLKPIFTIDYLKNSMKRSLDNYQAKYIETSSVNPLFHICFWRTIFSYLVALPEEHCHLSTSSRPAIDPLLLFSAFGYRDAVMLDVGEVLEDCCDLFLFLNVGY
ncbi:Unknown protein [Striga hermonthica]|uniref:Uncharacterized protein n=1 Tax=Striga hermonthica TaxID=68872 RepID=A0A9N7MWI0_STRHE|nr:Unknown protein [Striga hermonthica]